MSKPKNKITRTIRSEQVLKAFVKVVRKNLPLDLKNTRITADDIIYALAYANVHRLSIESACEELQGAPSGNRLREVLVDALPRSDRDAANAEQDVSPTTASEYLEMQTRLEHCD
jgi:hypothetical protein